MECFNTLRTQVSEEALDLTCFKEKPNAHDTHAVLLWYEKLGLYAFKLPSLHQWQVQLSMKIHFNHQDVFRIIATGAGKSTLIHLPILADMALCQETISLVTIPMKALSTVHVCQNFILWYPSAFNPFLGIKCSEIWYICSSYQ